MGKAREKLMCENMHHKDTKTRRKNMIEPRRYRGTEKAFRGKANFDALSSRLRVFVPSWFNFCACIFLILPIAGPAHAASVRDTLDQMGALEKQIDGLRKSQWEERNRLLKVEGSLQSIEKRLGERSALKREGEQFLSQYQSQSAKETERIDNQMQDDLSRMRAARRGLARERGRGDCNRGKDKDEVFHGRSYAP
jgi:predicted ATP-binding protein involved in virulence